jgi:hypothetical protein
MSPQFAGYEASTDRIIPVVLFERREFGEVGVRLVKS